MLDPEIIAVYNLARSDRLNSLRLWIVIGSYIITGRVISKREENQRQAAKRTGESPGDALAVNATIDRWVSDTQEQDGNENAPEFLQLVDADIFVNGAMIETPSDFRVNPDLIIAWGVIA